MELRHSRSRLRARSAVLRGRENQPQVKRSRKISLVMFWVFVKGGRLLLLQTHSPHLKEGAIGAVCCSDLIKGTRGRTV